MVQPLIDADILRYEIGAIGDKFNKETGEWEVKNFDFVAQILDDKIEDICKGAGATEPPILFLSANRENYKLYKGHVNNVDYIPNFREQVSTERTYKGTRKQDKPYHWSNLTAYILANYPTVVANGCEADDLICIEQYSKLFEQSTIICTRDKDLRQCPGWHYGWEVGNQSEFGPIYYDEFGSIELVKLKSGYKIIGGGWLFFCAQLLTGDVVDTVGGARGIGPVKAYDILMDSRTKQEAFTAVRECYQRVSPDDWEANLRGQCSLLWIVRERNEDGSLKHFNIEEWL